MSSENCFNRCEEWEALNTQLDTALDSEYAKMAAATKQYRDLCVQSSGVVTQRIGVLGKALEETQDAARIAISELMFDRDEAEAIVTACDKSVCAAAQFCISQFASQEAR